MIDGLDTREWLLTNGLGGFASGTICDAHTRTYHGWLMAAIAPPGQRTLLLSHIDAYLQVGDQGHELSTNIWGSGTVAPTGYQLLQAFQIDPVPTWTWGCDPWQLTREIAMPSGLISGDAETELPQFRNQVLIRYRYQGNQPAILILRPLIGDRNFHAQQHVDPALQFSQLVEPRRVLFQATRDDWLGTPWQLSWSRGRYQPAGVWYWDYGYLEETQRGLNDREDLYSPGYLTLTLQPGDTLTLEARVRSAMPTQPFTPPTEETFEQAIKLLQHQFDYHYAQALSPKAIAPQHQQQWRQLLQAGDQFVAYRASIKGPTVIAGYPWFGDWGRDTLIALPGLALTPQRFALARGLLETFGHYCQDGLIPNTFPDTNETPAYNSIDAALWWIETLGLYLEASQDWAFLVEQYPIVRRIHKHFMAGTAYNIRVDARDSLVIWEAPGYALTWMDAIVNGQPATPRQGKPVEINALWYSALCWAEKWATRLHQVTQADESTKYATQARSYAQQAERVKAALEQFWNPEHAYFYDTIEPNDHRNPQIRPNAVIALSLYHCGFPAHQAQAVLEQARDRLLTPYGLRSLDPADPHYIGRYEGGPAQRDNAYHQGTVWSWLIGPFIRAWQRFYPDKPLPWTSDRLMEHMQNQACLGSISEIFDGDAPHRPKGAIAQAWSVAELIRHWHDLG